MGASPQELKRIYIVPTGHGLIFLALILIIVLVAASSGNNLIYGLAFILFSVFVMSMISTHVNLKSLKVEWVGQDEFFANSPGTVWIRISHEHKRSHYLINAFARQGSLFTSKPVVGTISEISPRQTAMLKIPVTFGRRGVWPCPRLTVSTVYPLGLFRSWSYFKADEQVVVYPELIEGAQPAAEAVQVGVGDSHELSRDSQHEDFREHSKFQLGESQHHVDWKAYARFGEMLSKKYESHSPQHFVLKWDLFRHSERELALSQMAHAVDKLRHSGASFSMEIPGYQLPVGQGEFHVKAAFEALARFEGAAA